MVELLVFNGSRAGTRFLVPDVPTVLGRSPEAHLRVDDPWISNLHALFEERGDGLWVVDLGSRNGTFVRGRRVAEARVAPGDVVAFGQTEVRLEPAGAAAGPREAPTRTPVHTVAVNATVRSARPPSGASPQGAPTAEPVDPSQPDPSE